jgi:nitrite reductase (NO-forming)
MCPPSAIRTEARFTSPHKGGAVTLDDSVLGMNRAEPRSRHERAPGKDCDSVATTTNTDRKAAQSLPTPSAPLLRRLHGAAAVRISFGLIWAIDASFKWLPGFIHGQTLSDELGAAGQIHTPVLHQWISMWHSVATSHPGAFAIGTAVIETAIAFGMVFGVMSNLLFVGSALYSIGVWSSAEAFGLPWTASGITDVGVMSGYVFASLALLYAFGGATWSLDARLRPLLGRFGRLSSPSPEEISARLV